MAWDLARVAGKLQTLVLQLRTSRDIARAEATEAADAARSAEERADVSTRELSAAQQVVAEQSREGLRLQVSVTLDRLDVRCQ